MKKGIIVRGLVAAVILAGVAHIGARRVGPIPPLGQLLDPWHGAWAAAAVSELPDQQTVAFAALDAPVRVVFDVRGVPHIFAESQEDAARALGYVVARDRLFQLEMRWRSTAGRVSELVGYVALGFDRYIRELGLAWSAERDFAALDPGSDALAMMNAYAEGVNAWIDGLGSRDVPVEYRILGATPSRWEPVYSFYLLKQMGWNLSHGIETDLLRLRAMARVGREATDALLPVNNPIQQPIQPNGQADPRYDFAPIPPPGAPDEQAAALADDIESFLGPLALRSEADRVLGSNNWVVSPDRTESGYALLSGDPHLGLTLPSIWYEAHMVVPGELDVYGVTIPSNPVVILGFNRDVAWSMTNTGADVIDYYEEVFDDPDRPTRYRVDDEWRPLEIRTEQYFGRGGRLLGTDTLYVTHRGPVIEADDRKLSMRWTVLEPQGVTQAVMRVATTTTVEEYLEAMETFNAPAQNMVVADRNGTVAIRSTGHYPLQPDNSGLPVRDGTQSTSDWLGYWPPERYPQSVSPDQGYLASANQQPIDPLADSTYMGANWPSPWRAIRINQLLAADSVVTPEAMQRYQLDPGNARADMFVPFLIDAARGRAEQGEYDDAALEAAELLSQWDRLYTKANERAVLFELAMDELYDRTWDELLGEPEGERRARRVFTPASAVLASLLHQPESVWWDDSRTSNTVEDRDAILTASLAAALETAKREHGEPHDGGWRWDGIRHANIYHLLNLGSFSALDLPIQGGSGTLNPSSGGGTHGASWRMVVQLGPEIEAWSIYPGGQSGNPVSSRYADRIEKWVNGELDPVVLPRQASDIRRSQTASVLQLNPER
jgi:penicillin amidase